MSAPQGFSATRAALTRAVETGPPHLRPIARAVRDHGCTQAVVPQNAGPFTLPLDRPTIAIIGDDAAEALGVDAFDRSSLARLFAACGRIAIVASAPQADVYQAVAMAAAMLRLHVAVVETRGRYEADWLHFVEQAAPGTSVLLCTEAAAGHA